MKTSLPTNELRNFLIAKGGELYNMEGTMEKWAFFVRDHYIIVPINTAFTMVPAFFIQITLKRLGLTWADYSQDTATTVLTSPSQS